MQSTYDRTYNSMCPPRCHAQQRASPCYWRDLLHGYSMTPPNAFLPLIKQQSCSLRTTRQKTSTTPIAFVADIRTARETSSNAIVDCGSGPSPLYDTNTCTTQITVKLRNVFTLCAKKRTRYNRMEHERFKAEAQTQIAHDYDTHTYSRAL